MSDLISAQISTDGTPAVAPAAPNVITTETATGVTVRPGETPKVEVAPAARPEGLPEKFRDISALAKAYEALEKKLGAAPATPTPTTTPAAGPLDMAKLSQEYAANNGVLTAETLKTLADRGITPADVTTFVRGQQAVAAAQRADLSQVVGGEENLTTLLEWAKTGLSAGEKDAYNAMIAANNNDGAKALLGQFAAKYDAEFGSEGNRVVAPNGVAQGTVAFRSSAEVTAAMRDPRYQTDAAYRKDVETRLAISNVFGK